MLRELARLATWVGKPSADAQVGHACSLCDAVGAIAYSGPFVPSYRSALLADWTAKLVEVGLPHSPHANLTKTLADPVQVAFNWCLQSSATTAQLLLRPEAATS